MPCWAPRIASFHSDRPEPDRRPADDIADVVVIGGGPSGTIAARLLASWGHDVRLLTRRADPARALANSLPPSTRKLLARVGALELVDRIGHRTTGNTVWWGSRDGHVEPFSTDGSSWGYQVDRAQLDPLLLHEAAAAGVRVEADAHVERVTPVEEIEQVAYVTALGPRSCRARMVLDCSGRKGVLAVARRLRRHVSGGRMQALVGVWERPGGWFLQNPSHTVIETFEEGWAWSIPTCDSIRHVGIMVDGATSRVTRGPSLEATFRSQLALTPRIDRQVRGSRLDRVFACDSTVYTAERHAGPAFLLVGDAGSTLNPLSSFGVKKALASAWLSAVVAHTSLGYPERANAAQAFFSRWSSQVWQVNLRRSRDFAREARTRHESAFWSAQADAVVDDAQLPHDESELMGSPEVRAALARLREADTVVFSRTGSRTFVSAPVVRANEVAIEDAVAVGPEARDVLRYVRGIDLVTLATIAPLYSDIPLMYQEYCSRHGAVPLPEFLGSLSLLIARGILCADGVGLVSSA